MSEPRAPQVAIVDFGLGNLFSVSQACRRVGLTARITEQRADVLGAQALILPGVGAFGDAMAALARLDLLGAIGDFAASGRPLLGICLGMQLLMAQSLEFGSHAGLGLIGGDVVHLGQPREGDRRLKVPQVGWNRIEPPPGGDWRGSLLEGLEPGEFMYFVHSFYCRPADPGLVLTQTDYGQVRFCSGLSQGNITACQFHPERSGQAGLTIYRNLAARLGVGAGRA
ncbi:MAG: imidazole glycerol phosphate synthase subunit HisH [Pseudomonadota bacterium]